MVFQRNGIILLLTLCLVFMATSCSGNGLDPDIEAKIDEFAKAVLGCREMVGMSVVIVQGGSVNFTRGYGIRDLETGENVTESTLFGVASVSKAFATTLLAKLLERSEDHSWDSKVRDIVGDEFFFHDALRTLSMSLRDLASHKTGLGDAGGIRYALRKKDELVQKLRFLEPRLVFRDSYIYNNLMYGLLSLAAERLEEEKSWEDLITDELYKPIGMDTASFTHKADLESPDVARAYARDNEGEWRRTSPVRHRHWGEMGGSGSVMLSATDASKWLYFLLHKGRNIWGEQVVSEEALDETFSPVNVRPSSDEEWERPISPVTITRGLYSLGWTTGFYRGFPLIAHTGTSSGYNAYLTLLPTEGIGIHTSVTGRDPGYKGRKLLHYYIMDLLTGDMPWLNLTSACDYLPTERHQNENLNKRDSPKIPMLAIRTYDLQPYVGQYGDFFHGNLSVTLNETQLQVEYGDFAVWYLSPKTEIHPMTFTGTGNENVWDIFLDPVVFSSSEENGKIDQVQMPFSFRPVFRRDLKMSDAPPPPKIECDEVTLPPPPVAASVIPSYHWPMIVISLALCQSEFPLTS